MVSRLGKLTIDAAAAHFNVARSTIIKGRHRESFEDHSHQLHTAPTSIQEDMIVE